MQCHCPTPRVFWCIQSLSVKFFDDLLSLKIYHFEKQSCHLLKIIRQKDDSNRRLKQYKIQNLDSQAVQNLNSNLNKL